MRTFANTKRKIPSINLSLSVQLNTTKACLIFCAMTCPYSLALLDPQIVFLKLSLVHLIPDLDNVLNSLYDCPQECISLQGHFVGTACGHHGPYTPDVLFWSTILFFSTFFMSAFLKQFKTSRYFPTKVTTLYDSSQSKGLSHQWPWLFNTLIFHIQVRSMISDFAVFLTIAVMVLLDYAIGVPSQKLKVPSKFQV